MVLRAREVMTARVVSVGPDTPVAVAREWLAETRFGALPVVDERNRLVGIVTAADLIVDPSSSERARHPAPTVAAVMNRDVMSMSPDADVGIVAHRMRTYGGRSWTTGSSSGS
jgi:CBS-domain-containing membrane protein